MFKLLVCIFCSDFHYAKSNDMSFRNGLTFFVISQKKLTLTKEKIFCKVFNLIRITEHVCSRHDISGIRFLVPNCIIKCVLKVILACYIHFTVVMVYESIFLELVVHNVIVVQSKVETQLCVFRLYPSSFL